MANTYSNSRQNIYQNGAFEGDDDSNSRYRLPSSVSYMSSSSNMANLGPRASKKPSDEEVIRPQKKVGLLSGVALIVGTMIGSGIFISPKEVTLGAGSMGHSLIIWVVCGIIALCGALSYAELGAMVVRSGAGYSYIHQAFSSYHPFFGPVPAFLFAWTNAVVLKPAQVAIIVLTMSKYLIEPFYISCESSAGSVKCLAAFIILVLMLVNCWSVRMATSVQTILMVAKVAALVVIVIGGFAVMGQDGKGLSNGFIGTNRDAGHIAIAYYHGMWAYDGWDNLNYVTEELINVERNLLLSILIAIPLVSGLYLLTNVSYFAAMSVSQVTTSPAVAMTWGNHVLGPVSWFIPLFVVISTFGAANGMLFSTGRLNFVAAREGHMTKILSMLHVTKYTPIPSIIFTSLLAIMFIIPADISTLINFFSFAAWIFYGASMLALIVMRFTHKKLARPFKVFIGIPIFMFIVSIYLVLAPISVSPKWEFLYSFLFIIAGLFLYVPFVYYKKKIPGLDSITTFLQLLTESAPTEVLDPIMAD